VSINVAGDRPASALLVDALRELDTRALTVQDLAVRRPTLDDVFLALTGHAAEPTEEEQS